MDKSLVIKLLNLLCLLGAVVWLARNPDWEPALTSLVFLTTFIATELNDRKPESNKNAKSGSIIDSQLVVEAPPDDSRFKAGVHQYLTKSVTVKKARMIQYSGDMVKGIVSKLLEKSVDVELLLQHPGCAINEFQWNKMAVFRERLKSDCVNLEKLKIRYYRETPSLRAIKIDSKMLALGWYTFRGRLSDSVRPWLYGHNNPNVVIDISGGANSHFEKFFDTLFDELWECAVPAEKVEFENSFEKQRSRLIPVTPERGAPTPSSTRRRSQRT